MNIESIFDINLGRIDVTYNISACGADVRQKLSDCSRCFCHDIILRTRQGCLRDLLLLTVRVHEVCALRENCDKVKFNGLTILRTCGTDLCPINYRQLCLYRWKFFRGSVSNRRPEKGPFDFFRWREISFALDKHNLIRKSRVVVRRNPRHPPALSLPFAPRRTAL